jgi:hypothetical protein
VSLNALKLSMSSRISAAGGPFGVGVGHGQLELVAELAMVRQPGQAVGHRLAVEVLVAEHVDHGDRGLVAQVRE